MVEHEQNATALVISLLSSVLDCPVSSEMPKDGIPTRYVNVSQVGDESTQFLSLPTIELLVWDKTDAAASQLALDCFETLSSACDDDPYLSAVQMNSLSRDTWMNTGHARYRLDLDLTINK